MVTTAPAWRIPRMTDRLHHLLESSAARYPDSTALLEADGGAVTFAGLEAQATFIARRLVEAGVRPGDRVGLYAPKSIPLAAALFGVLKAGAAYVPVDPGSPVARAAYIFRDCAVRCIVTDPALLAKLRETEGNDTCREVAVIDPPGGQGEWLRLAQGLGRAGGSPENAIADLAYILYTSGSTGQPKGVMHRHASALSFINWCSTVLAPQPEDRFSSHAPFHFDLSILDVFVPVKHGASVVLIDDQLGKQPAALAEMIAATGISIWYSTPSILRLLVEFGKLAQHDYPRLRVVCFAGEVFPVKHFEALVRCWPQPRYLNLYGPTETNVCTYYEAKSEDRDGRATPLPIGYVCSGDKARVVGVEDAAVGPGAQGELLISGGSVMAGYWNLPERNAEAFLIDEHGTPWYRTGDIVIEAADGCFTFVGRRDRMVKRRSYRVELGEVEAALHRHPAIREAAVIATPDEQNGVLITAFLSWDGPTRPSLIELKKFSSEQLPIYMVPDRFRVLPQLPKTSTDKIDYQRLKDL
jgi:amino acid adenylation domain-containing protein